MNLLSILANPKPVNESACLQIEQAFREEFQKVQPDVKIAQLHVYDVEIPLLDRKLLPAFWGGSDAGDPDIARRLARQQELVQQFVEADIIVIASPMWNFSVPPLLKAYIDNIVVAGKTFRYTESGPEGLLVNKRAVLCLSSGGIYEGQMAAYNHLTPYLRTVLGFLGVTNVVEIMAQGQALGPETAKAQLNAAIEKARETARALAST